MKKQSIGIYWNDAFIYICSLRSSPAGLAIERLIKHKRDRVANEGIAKEIKALMEENDFALDACVVSLPESAVMYRFMERPFSDRKKISATISSELETMLPSGEDDLIFDFVLTGKTSSGHTLLSVVAAYAPSVREIVSELNNVGIDPESIDSCAAATIVGARNLFYLSPEGKYALVHVGEKDSSISVFHGQEIKHIDSLPFGIERFASIESIQSVEGGSLSAELAREIGLSLYRIDQNLQGYEIILTGYAGFIQDLPKAIENTLSVKVGMPSEGGVAFNGLKEDLVEPFMAISLALRGIDKRDLTDFRKGEFVFTKKREELRKYVVSFGATFIAFLILLTASLSLDVFLKGRIKDKLESRIKKEFVSVMPKGTPVVEPVKQMEQYFSQRSKEAGVFDVEGVNNPLDIIKDISAVIPAGSGTVIDSMSVDLNEIAISGKANSYNEVDRIKASLSNLKYISEVKISAANVDKSDQTITFKLICKRGV
jgi:Tfp pilus assembly PilM family ATPase